MKHARHINFLTFTGNKLEMITRNNAHINNLIEIYRNKLQKHRIWQPTVFLMPCIHTKLIVLHPQIPNFEIKKAKFN
jgi:hypothetical protein